MVGLKSKVLSSSAFFLRQCCFLTLAVVLLVIAAPTPAHSQLFGKKKDKLMRVEQKKEKKVFFLKRWFSGNKRKRVKDRYKQPASKKVWREKKTIPASTPARITPSDPVSKDFDPPRRISTNGKVKDRYRQPASKKIWGNKKAKRVVSPPTISKARPVSKDFDPPDRVNNDGKVKVIYKQPPSKNIWGGKKKDTYQRPASIPASRAGQVPVEEAPGRPAPGMEEGQKDAPRRNPLFKPWGEEPALFEGRQPVPDKTEGTPGTGFSGKIIRKDAVKTGQGPEPLFQGRFQHTSEKDRKKRYQELADEVGRYEGAVPGASPGRKTRGPGTLHQGRMEQISLKTRIKRYRKLSAQQNQYAGNIDARRVKPSGPGPEPEFQGRFEGESKNQQTRRYEKLSEETGSYAGRQQTMTKRARTRYEKKQSEEIHLFAGNIKIRKMQNNMHPSAGYLEAKRKGSYHKQEQSRKWQLFFNRLFSKKEQPESVKEKPRKPRYNKEESEIWYY